MRGLPAGYEVVAVVLDIFGGRSIGTSTKFGTGEAAETVALVVGNVIKNWFHYMADIASVVVQIEDKRVVR